MSGGQGRRRGLRRRLERRRWRVVAQWVVLWWGWWSRARGHLIIMIFIKIKLIIITVRESVARTWVTWCWGCCACSPLLQLSLSWSQLASLTLSPSMASSFLFTPSGLSLTLSSKPLSPFLNSYFTLMPFSSGLFVIVW